MRNETRAIVLACTGLLLLAGAGPVGAASDPGPRGVKQAHRAVVIAHRATERAKAAERESRATESATRAYSSRYGAPVGRWVYAARRAGFTWSQLGTLFPIMLRESGGDPRAKNPSSTASGLGQFLAFFWDGSDSYFRSLFRKYHLAYPWNPFDGWQNLLHWRVVVKELGWVPWQL